MIYILHNTVFNFQPRPDKGYNKQNLLKSDAKYED